MHSEKDEIINKHAAQINEAAQVLAVQRILVSRGICYFSELEEEVVKAIVILSESISNSDGDGVAKAIKKYVEYGT